MALEVVPENTTSYLTITFLDKSGNQTQPTSATWEMIDIRSGQELKSATAITPIAAQVEITIPSSLNAMVNEKNEEEKKRVIVKASYGADDKANDQYDYLVHNLSAV